MKNFILILSLAGLTCVVVKADDTRTKLINTLAQQHSLKSETGEPLKMQPDPLLVWSNPVRGDTTGGIFLWCNGKRPVAFGGVYTWNEDGKTLFSRELHSLTEEPLVASFHGEAIWSPDSSNLQFKELKAGTIPARSTFQRLRQIKRIASEFHLEISQPNRSSDRLRALPTPIYRYHDDKSGIIDGAIVAFCQGNDPEAMLIIEAVKTEDSVRWRYAFARCTGWAVDAQLNDEPVFHVDPYRFGFTSTSSPFLIVTKRPL